MPFQYLYAAILQTPKRVWGDGYHSQPFLLVGKGMEAHLYLVLGKAPMTYRNIQRPCHRYYQLTFIFHNFSSFMQSRHPWVKRDGPFSTVHALYTNRNHHSQQSRKSNNLNCSTSNNSHIPSFFLACLIIP